MTGFVKADICRQVSVCLRVFCGILFALKPFRDYSLCSVCILPQSAFYPSLRFTLVCSLHFALSLHFTPGPQSAFYIDRNINRVTLQHNNEFIMLKFLFNGFITMCNLEKRLIGATFWVLLQPMFMKDWKQTAQRLKLQKRLLTINKRNIIRWNI